MRGLTLGIDMGTSSSKAVLVTAAGEVVASASRSHSLVLPRPGWAEADAEATWWGDVVALCREVLPQAGGEEVLGLCVSGVGPCLVLTGPGDGGSDTVLRPAILYGIDTRATAEIDELTARYGRDEVLRRCGKLLSSQAVGPKMLWVQRHEPEVWARARRWFGSSSFVVHRLTGAYVQDHPTASMCDPLYDIRAQRWDDRVAAEVAPGVEMPALAWPGEVVGRVHAAAAELTGLAVGTPVCAGTTDAWAEAHGCGVRRPGDVMLMYGSTTLLVQLRPELHVDPALWATSGVLPGQHTLTAGTATSGSITGWLRDLTGGASFEQLAREAAAVPPGSEGLLVLPHFAGERTPLFDPLARGVVAGLTLRHGRGHLYRAVYEGVAFAVRQLLALMEADLAPGQPPSRVVAVGGGTTDRLWPQVVSDVCGRTQQLPAQRVGACYGDALLAAVGVGLVPEGTDWTRIVSEVVPDPAAVEVYDRLFPVHRDLYPAVREQVHALATFGQQQGGAGSAVAVPPPPPARAAPAQPSHRPPRPADPPTARPAPAADARGAAR